MQFEWSETQEQLYRTVKAFARAELNHELQERRKTHALCERAWRACGRMGLLGLSVPKPSGGGLDAMTTARVMEAFGEGCEDMGLLFSAAAHLNACAMPIAEHAGDDLKQRLLPGLCDGSLIGANAISEASAGSDLASLKTRAIRVGDEYVISGEKSFVTNGAVADVFTVYAVTEPGAGYMGISAFIVERAEHSVRPGKPFEKLGLATAQTGPVLFEECRVPASNLLGAEGHGLRIFNRSMAWERTCLFAGYLGQMQRQLDATIVYATERKQFGKAIARNQAVSHRIVDMKVRLEAARMLLYRACWAIDRGMQADLHVSMAKLAISEAAVTSALDSIRVHGGLGVMMESGVPQALGDAVPCTIFSGTSDLQRNIIAKELGL